MLLDVWNWFVCVSCGASTSVSLGRGLMFPSLRKLDPGACEGLSVSGCHSSPHPEPASPCLAFLSAEHFLLLQGCHGDEHAHTGIDWAMPLLFLRQQPKNAVPLFGMTGAHMDTHTHTELDTDSGAAQCRLWSVVYVATMCQSSCHIAECWNPFSSAVCRPWTHKVLRCTFELGDCRWTAAVTVPQWRRRLFYDLFYGYQPWCRCGLVCYRSSAFAE